MFLNCHYFFERLFKVESLENQFKEEIKLTQQHIKAESRLNMSIYFIFDEIVHKSLDNTAYAIETDLDFNNLQIFKNSIRLFCVILNRCKST